MSNARDFASRVPVDGALSNRNLIINGAMQVAQRGSSGTVGASLHYVSDRWQHRSSAQVGGTTTYSQAVVNGQTRLRLNYSGATGSAYIQQAVEAQNLNGVWGKDVTISFYTTDASPSVFVFGYNASAVESTFLSQTAATSLGDNRWSVTFNLAEPSGGASTGTAYGMGVVIYPNGGSTPSDGDIDFWNVQLEVGDGPATPFEHRRYSDELQSCMRYFQILMSKGENYHAQTMWATNTPADSHSMALMFPHEMRAAPTGTLFGTPINISGGSAGTSTWAIYGANGWRGAYDLLISQVSTTSCRIDCRSNDGATAGGAVGLYGGPDCYWELDAEL